MMKAVVIEKHGGPEVLEIKEVPKPSIEPGEVLVRQVSTSVNPVDAKDREKWAQKLPKILGGDVAGLVEETKDDRFKKGDRVFALTPGFMWDNNDNKYGSYAEFTAAKAPWLARPPCDLLLNVAGGVPLVGLTAFQALNSADPPLKPGGRVLVHGGAGGVGHLVVQLAKKHWKAYVVTTAGPSNVDFIQQELGQYVDEVVDYTKEDFSEKYASAPFDVIVDSVAGPTEEKSYKVLAKGGTYAHILSPRTDQEKVKAGKAWKERRYALILVQPNGEQLQVIANYFKEAEIRLVVERIFKLAEVREAQEFVEKHHSRGKVVIDIWHEPVADWPPS